MNRLVVVMGCAAVLGGVARAEDEGAEPGAGNGVDGATTGTGSGSATAAKVDATVEAVQTQPQVPTVRGGTLGIPAVLGTEGLQLIVSGQPASTGATTPKLPGKIGFDVFTRLGGLRLFESISVDILAESYKQALPHVDLLTRPVLPQMTLTEIRAVGFRARWAAERATRVSVIKKDARAAPEPGESVVSQFIRQNRWTISGGARFLQRATPERDALDFSGAAAELVVQYTRSKFGADQGCKQLQVAAAQTTLKRASAELDTTRTVHRGTPIPVGRQIREEEIGPAIAGLATQLNTADKSLSAAMIKPDEEALKKARTQLSTLLKQADEANDLAVRSTQPAEATSDPLRVAGPMPAPVLDPLVASTARFASIVTTSVESIDRAWKSCAITGFGVTFFGGLSTTMLHTQKAQDETQNTEDPLFQEARLTLGVDLRTTFTGAGTTLLPRVGAYAVLSRGWWHDRFAVSGGKDIDAYQLEAALYVSGHLLGGFDAVVSFVALKPYGRDGYEFLINVAPALGAAIGGS